MNPWGSKHLRVEDAKNLIKTLIWNVCILLVYVTWMSRTSVWAVAYAVKNLKPETNVSNV